MGSKKKATLVINPRTGQNVTKLPDVLAVLAAAGWKTEIALKEYGGQSMELANQASKNADMLIAYGGDGTVNQVVNGVMHHKKAGSNMAVIPGGTANLWAGDIGVPSDPVQAALALVNSEVRKVDVGCVSVAKIASPEATTDDQPTSAANHSDEKKKPKKAGRPRKPVRDHFLLMAGLGFDAAVMNNVSKPLKYHIGPLAVGLAAAKNLPTQRPFPIEIEATGNGQTEDLRWKGEALQVIIGNTRRYAMVLETTPNAYIDDGLLDLCIITAGDPLTTMQQVSSLLLHRKPENNTTETFQGARLSITVPASVPLEVDGSTVKLKDFLSKADATALEQARDCEQVMVTYRFEAKPLALGVAIPHTYDDSLFEHAEQDGKQNGKHHEQKEHVVRAAHQRRDEAVPQTALQEQTANIESQPAHPMDESKQKQKDEVRKELPALVSALLENGRKVAVVGKVPNPEQPGTYIVAGEIKQASTGDLKPVAVVLTKDTTIFSREGDRLPIDAAQELQRDTIIVVEGKRSKRGVIRASRAVL